MGNRTNAGGVILKGTSKIDSWRWRHVSIMTCQITNNSFVHLTLKHRETHGCVVSTVATDSLVLKHQAISIHNAD